MVDLVQETVQHFLLTDSLHAPLKRQIPLERKSAQLGGLGIFS